MAVLTDISSNSYSHISAEQSAELKNIEKTAVTYLGRMIAMEEENLAGISFMENAGSMQSRTIMISGIPSKISKQTLIEVVTRIEEVNHFDMDLDEVSSRIQSEGWADSTSEIIVGELTQYSSLIINLKSTQHFSADGLIVPESQSNRDSPFPLLYSFLDSPRFPSVEEAGGRSIRVSLRFMYTITSINDSRQKSMVKIPAAHVRGLQGQGDGFADTYSKAKKLVEDCLASEGALEIHKELEYY